MLFDEIAKHIEGGRNATYRRVDRNTYAILATDGAGNSLNGIQLHKTVIYACYPNGNFQVSNGGWNTVTTRKRLNNIFHAIAFPYEYHTKKNQAHLLPVTRQSYWSDYRNEEVVYYACDWKAAPIAFDKGFSVIDGTIHVDDVEYIIPNEYVCSLTDKTWQSWDNAKKENERRRACRV